MHAHDENLGDHTITVKKVFITFVQGPYVFKKRREKGNRVTFTCNGCQKVNHYLPVVAVRDRYDTDAEHDAASYIEDHAAKDVDKDDEKLSVHHPLLTWLSTPTETGSDSVDGT